MERFCSQCGKKITSGGEFCPYCGAALKSRQAAVPQTQSPVIVVPNMFSEKKHSDTGFWIGFTLFAIALILIMAGTLVFSRQINTVTEPYGIRIPNALSLLTDATSEPNVQKPAETSLGVDAIACKATDKSAIVETIGFNGANPVFLEDTAKTPKADGKLRIYCFDGGKMKTWLAAPSATKEKTNKEILLGILTDGRSEVEASSIIKQLDSTDQGFWVFDSMIPVENTGPTKEAPDSVTGDMSKQDTGALPVTAATPLPNDAGKSEGTEQKVPILMPETLPKNDVFISAPQKVVPVIVTKDKNGQWVQQPAGQVISTTCPDGRVIPIPELGLGWCNEQPIQPQQVQQQPAVMPQIGGIQQYVPQPQVGQVQQPSVPQLQNQVPIVMPDTNLPPVLQQLPQNTSAGMCPDGRFIPIPELGNAWCNGQ